MNHIHRITQERDAAQEKIRDLEDRLRDLEHYLLSDKFSWPENDYVHVRTDILPKISTIRFAAISQLTDQQQRHRADDRHSPSYDHFS